MIAWAREYALEIATTLFCAVVVSFLVWILIRSSAAERASFADCVDRGNEPLWCYDRESAGGL